MQDAVVTPQNDATKTSRRYTATPWKAAQYQSKKSPLWRSNYGMSSDFETFNALSAGMLNRFSPTQNVRLVADIFNPEISWHDVTNSMVMGNNGIVTDQYAKEHPYLAMAANLAADIVLGGLGARALRGKSVDIPEAKLVNTVENGDQALLSDSKSLVVEPQYSESFSQAQGRGTGTSGTSASNNAGKKLVLPTVQANDISTWERVAPVWDSSVSKTSPEYLDRLGRAFDVIMDKRDVAPATVSPQRYRKIH